MMVYILGLDLGVQSIGWSIIPIDEKNGPAMRLGVRCFDTAIDNVGDWESGAVGKDGKPKAKTNNFKRRAARSVRRNQWRRKRRTLKLFNLLRNHGLLPMGKGIHDESLDRQELINTLDKELAARISLNEDRVAAHLLPYKLRAMALDEKLEPFAFGRALLHLSQRRGFLSNKKAPAKEGEDEKGLKKDINDLCMEIEEKGFRTLGEYFASLDPEEKRIRQRWTGRGMLNDEFNTICDCQDQYYHDLLKKTVIVDSWKSNPNAWKYDIKKNKRKKIFSNEHFHEEKMTLREAIEKTLFFQRPLKSQKHLIGKCQLERGKRRAQLASLEAQRFRYWQKILDIDVQLPDGTFRNLTPQEMDILAGELATKEKLTFAAIKKLLPDLNKFCKFNLETEGVKDIRGNSTTARIAKIIPDQWNAMPDAEKESLVSEILQFEHEDALARRLQKVFKFDSNTASQLAAVQLERDYASLSKQAIRRILPLMMEKRISFATARKEIYGDQFDEERKEVLDDLPPVLKAVKDLKNPVVTRTLTELRKVVNAIIREYGKPAIIRVELARDMKKSRPDREKLSREMKQQEKRRMDAKTRIFKEIGIQEPRKGDILKVLLAEECNWECPYTGNTITIPNLLGPHPQFDIEHTLPFSRSLDNSFVNKTLCYVDENRHVKKNQTPFEAYGRDPHRWHEILERVKRFRGSAAEAKLRRFQMEEIPDGFTNRHLSDTRYISRLAGDYLGLLYGGRIDADGTLRIQISTGAMTAYLRDEWELNAILDDGGDAKNRSDHRHHAVDAAVIAMNDSKTIQMLSRAAERASLEGHRLFSKGIIEPPMDDFYDNVKLAVDKINISFRANRKVSGGFHDETNYSDPHKFKDEKGKTQEVRHIRKSIIGMSEGDIENIVDPTIRELVIKKLEQLGMKDAKKLPESELPYLRSKDGKRLIPIRKARIRKNVGTMTIGKNGRERHVAPGNNHHMEVYALCDAQGREIGLDWIVVNLFDSLQRIKQKKPVICRSYDEYMEKKDEKEKKKLKKMGVSLAKFLFSLGKGEYVLATLPDEGEVLLKVCKISDGDISLSLNTDARPENQRKETGDFQKYRIASIKKLQQFQLKKVVVDVLGNIHPATD